jgi:hypothetical protein
VTWVFVRIPGPPGQSCQLTCAEFGREVSFVPTRNLQVSYIGHATMTG